MPVEDPVFSNEALNTLGYTEAIVILAEIANLEAIIIGSS